MSDRNCEDVPLPPHPAEPHFPDEHVTPFDDARKDRQRRIDERAQEMADPEWFFRLARGELDLDPLSPLPTTPEARAAVPHFSNDQIDVARHTQDYVDRIEWQAKANFEGRQLEEAHGNLCGHRSQLNYEHTRWAVCSLPKDHDGLHRMGDLEWATGFMPCRVGGRQNPPKPPAVGELWTTFPQDDMPSQGTDSQVRAWLMAAPGPPVVQVIDTGLGDTVYYRYVGLTPFDPATNNVTALPNKGWAAFDTAFRLSLSLFTDKFTRAP